MNTTLVTQSTLSAITGMRPSDISKRIDTGQISAWDISASRNPTHRAAIRVHAGEATGEPNRPIVQHSRPRIPVPEVAMVLSCTRVHVGHLIQARHLESQRDGHRMFVTRTSLDQFLSSRRL